MPAYAVPVRIDGNALELHSLQTHLAPPIFPSACNDRQGTSGGQVKRSSHFLSSSRSLLVTSYAPLLLKPPSTCRICPVMKPASSETRKASALAASTGVLARLMVCCDTTSFMISSTGGPLFHRWRPLSPDGKPFRIAVELVTFDRAHSSRG